MEYTTIRVKDSTKDNLDKFKRHPRETYNEVIEELIANVQT